MRRNKRGARGDVMSPRVCIVFQEAIPFSIVATQTGGNVKFPPAKYALRAGRLLPPPPNRRGVLYFQSVEKVRII